MCGEGVAGAARAAGYEGDSCPDGVPNAADGQRTPAAEDCGEGLVAGEMAKAADNFQAGELYEHCVEQFKEGLRLGNVVERLVYAHDNQLEALEEAAIAFFEEHVLLFHVGSPLTVGLALPCV